MTAEKTIGILGGMGPEASAECFSQIIANTPANRDQEHIRVVMDSNPGIPDRTAAIMGEGPSPAPIMIAGCEALARAGADCIIIPCITAHVWFDEVAAASPLPVLNMIDEVTLAIHSVYPKMETVGLVGTTGTLKGGLFHKRLAATDIRALSPADAGQARVMDAIYDIKSATSARSRNEVTAALISVCDGLVQAGAQGIIAACTEIPLALSQKDLTIPYFNSLRILARAAIRFAGRQPRA